MSQTEIYKPSPSRKYDAVPPPSPLLYNPKHEVPACFPMGLWPHLCDRTQGHRDLWKFSCETISPGTCSNLMDTKTKNQHGVFTAASHIYFTPRISFYILITNEIHFADNSTFFQIKHLPKRLFLRHNLGTKISQTDPAFKEHKL